ncbi:MAG: tetratricopeptide repeat protein [Psychroserpens sp.]|nr:tetratricopeptide repeat protein [Psychroserpens sp.]
MKFSSINIYILFGFFFFGWFSVQAQRIEIDRLEREFRGSFSSRKAYELSQKMIQLDSTYYVGHFFEANYRFYRAADKRGYETAIKSLVKAVELLEKDFPRKLKRSTNINVYIDQYLFQRKYAFLIYLLGKSYEYVDQPGEAIKVSRRLQKRNFICNFGVNAYENISWIYLRNRMYSPEKYDFLKPTIEENLETASKYADSIKTSDRYNQQYLDLWWPDFANNALLSYYHYKNIIYTHQLKLDSAEYFSQQLKKYDRLSYNNYGNLQFIQAKFPEAEESYETARQDDDYIDKSIKEFDYMQSAIKIFQNDLTASKSIVENSIKNLGTAPGFGWNNIALSRAYYYSGDLKMSKEFRDKAANFKEIHVGSTWGEVSYQRNTLLFEYLFHKKSIKEIQFRDQNYWYKPKKLYQMSKHHFKQENAHLLLTSELSADPERFIGYYNLFASENNIFFDEIWELIKYFNSDYFIEIFKEKLESDERERIHKYFNYFIAQFYLEDGDYDLAISEFKKSLENEYLDENTEKLLVARINEGLSKAYEEKGDLESANNHLMAFYLNFPQLVPYSDLTMKFNLEINNTSLTPEQEDIIETLKDCDIDWVENDLNWPTLKINLSKKDKNHIVNYQVVIANEVQFEGDLNLKDVENPGQLIAFSAFKINLE